MGKPRDFDGAVLIGPEHKLYHALLGLAGRVDELWLTPLKGLIIVDTKAGAEKAVPKRYALQIYLYALAAQPFISKNGYSLHSRGFIRWEHEGRVVYSPVAYPEGTLWLESLGNWTRATSMFLDLQEEAKSSRAVLARHRMDLFWCEQHGSLLTVDHLVSPGMTAWPPHDTATLPRMLAMILRTRHVPNLRGGVLYTDEHGFHWYATVLRHERRTTGLIGIVKTVLAMPRYRYAIGYWQKLTTRQAHELKRHGGGYIPVSNPIPQKLRIPSLLLRSDLSA